MLTHYSTFLSYVPQPTPTFLITSRIAIMWPAYVANQITLATKIMHSSVQFLKVEELTFLPYYHFLNLDEHLRLLRVNRSCELAF